MKFFQKYKSKVAALLAVSFMGTMQFIPTVSAGVGPGSNTGGAAGKGGMWAPFTSVGIISISTDGMSKTDGDYDGQPGISVQDAVHKYYMNSTPSGFPASDDILSGSFVQRAGLVSQNTREKDYADSTFYVQGNSNNNVGDLWIWNCKEAGAPTAIKPYKFNELKAIADSTTPAEDWVKIMDSLKGQTNHEQLKSYIAAMCTGKFDTAGALMKYIQGDGSEAANKEEKIRYLDMLTMVNSLSNTGLGGYQFTHQIKKFLKTWNAVDSDEFVVITLTNLGGTNSQNPRWVWSNATFYADMYSLNAYDFYYTPNSSNYESGEDAIEQADVQYFSSNYTSGRTAKSGYNNNCGIWATYALNSQGKVYNFGNSTDWRYQLMPTDKSGTKNGGSGYTFIANDSNNVIGPKAGVEHHLSANPKGKSAKSGDIVAADIVLNLKQSNDQKFNDLMTKFAKYPKAKVEIEITAQVTKGSMGGVGSGIIDTISGGCGATGSGSKIEINLDYGVNKAGIESLFRGGDPIKITDSGLTVSQIGPNEVKYSATGKIVWEGDDSQPDGAKFVSLGAEDAGSDKASDRASWLVPKDALHYYGGFKDPYVEIKEGTPGGEHFEAMAGVPTTEDLYLGFGAQEFILNFDGEMKSEGATRKYTINYNVGDCWSHNDKCTVSCPGHCSGSDDYTDDKGVEHCGKAGPCPDTKGGCTYYEPGTGCVCSNTQNQAHPRRCVHTISFTQDVSTYNYINITDAAMWQTQKMWLITDEKLVGVKEIQTDPNTGYRAFFSQSGYSFGNGRLVFSLIGDTDNQKYGDYVLNISGSGGKVHASIESEAIAALNKAHVGVKTNVMVVSDFIVMNTTAGNQVAMYYDYTSNEANISSGSASGQGLDYCPGSNTPPGVSNGQTLTFSKMPSFDDMWKNNGNSASKWKAEDLVRTGYNGNYASPSSKWNNTITQVQGADPSAKLKQHPNSSIDGNGGTGSGNGFGNRRMTVTGINIVDSTDENRNWSASDGVEPVYNGFYNTGNAYLTMPKVINFKNPGGTDWSNKGTSRDLEVPYSPAHDKINDIVVHNPVSVQYAFVLKNKPEYDMRTDESLASGGDPINSAKGCTGEGSCIFSTLTCTTPHNLHESSCYKTVQSGVNHVGGDNTHVHKPSCTHTHTSSCYHAHTSSCYTTTGGSNVCSYSYCMSYTGHDPSRCYYGHTCYGCDPCHDCVGSTVLNCGRDTTTPYCGLSTGYICGGSPANTHVCGSSCTPEYKNQLICQDPHHYSAGEPHDPNSTMSHYAFPDGRCYDPCGDDSKHKPPTTVVPPGGGAPIDTGDAFINLDKEFTVYYPNIGDFAMSPSMHGIAQCTSINGMGFVNQMDTTKWTREKFLTLPVNVIDSRGRSWLSGERIDMFDQDHDGNYNYIFYCVLSNVEQVNGRTDFNAIANNAREMKFYDESIDVTNTRKSPRGLDARHTAYKLQSIDVLGYIGNLTLNDTGDFRFATLFKKSKDNGKYIFENLVPEVDFRVPNKILTDNVDIRLQPASVDTDWHSTYGVTTFEMGGKAHPYISLPLTPAKNPIKVLQTEPMRPGYSLMMDIETVGNYYGENFDVNSMPADTNMYYKTQITPRYWSLNLDSGVWTPVDVYMGSKNDYAAVVKFNSKEKSFESYYYYLYWLEESERRNYNLKEQQTSQKVAEDYKDVAYDDVNGVEVPRIIRLPQATSDILGAANRLFLNDLNRTFIGSQYTYGVDTNPDGRFIEKLFRRQSQRWHFTLGLPSSSVFVEADKPCTEENIAKLATGNTVIVMAIDILSRGDVWTLEYKGNSINYSDGAGISIVPGGKVYPPPVDPETGKPLEDPIINIYHPTKTSKHDFITEGTH